jgi:hypothetical protein
MSIAPYFVDESITPGLSAVVLEILDRAFVLQRFFASVEGPEVFTLSGLRILLAGIESILA